MGRSHTPDRSGSLSGRELAALEMKTITKARRSIREPIPEIFLAWELLSQAADAHLQEHFARAETLLSQANMPEVYEWAWADWQKPSLNIRVPRPESDTKKLPKGQLDPVRAPKTATKRNVLARDGCRCRYCGIPVVDAGIRKLLHSLYPAAVPWVSSVPEKQHAAFSCFWLQYDHVVPHSRHLRSRTRSCPLMVKSVNMPFRNG
jgi:hypothetical protein